MATAAKRSSRAGWGALWALRLLLPLFLVCMWSTAGAQPGVLAVGAQPHYDISRDLLFMEDPSGAMGLEEVSAPATAARFAPFSQAGSAYNFGFTSSALWFRITLRAEADAPPFWYWKVALSTLDYLDLYASKPGGGYDHQQAGDERPMSAHAIRHKDHVLPVQLLPGGDTTVYLRVQSIGAIALPVTLWQPAAFHANDHVEYGLLSLYFGLVLGLFCYNLLLYFAIRDRAYLVYVVFVACMAISQAHFTGFAAEFVWRDNARWNTYGIVYFSPLTMLVAVLFTRTFLSSRRHMPRMDRVLQLLAAIWLLHFPAITLAPFVAVAISMQVMVILSVFACAAAGLISVRQKRPGARYFLLAWAILLVTMCVLALRNMGWVPAHFLTENPVLIASAMEMVLLSLALADRINVTRREQRRAESLNRVRQAQKAAADHAHAEKSRFLAAISHDLRQPMYALGLLLDGLRGAKLPEAFSSSLHDMKGSLTSINALLDSLMLMGRLEVGGLQPRMETFYVDQVLERVSNTFEGQAHAKGLKFNVTPTMCTLYSDPLLLERVLSNLVSNALRYTRTGGVLVSVRERREALLLQVWDTGRGIPADKQEAIFDEFTRLRGDDSDGGVGLGLTIVRSCTSLLGGSVGVRSTPGRGSCFSVWVPLHALPAVQQPARDTLARNLPSEPQNGPSQGLRVAVVDDDAVVLRALTASLASRDCDVTAAASWAELKDRLSGGEQPDVVICDFHVGRDTGTEIVARLRALMGRNIPAIIVTGDTSAETARGASESGLMLLHKPVAPQTLFAVAVQLAAQNGDV
ncbi:7TM diverse intracellular signaling domain-containing protein [Hydrogenophaga sp.]|uniref:7TM diverse intracellular signaling domain-containing protein n=1 Tax=Hydrogenophaga sp. TaxID=1904254 RepID=UPI002719FD23|nr:7TM diverse intracellular signaling domain-containing protein [Hydrogenophaga sp.]MDO9436344.1 7TM diverse intracellular signaling domain-containing protein [Hydrogenophaga sp.]